MSPNNGLQNGGDERPNHMPRGFPVHYEPSKETGDEAAFRESVIRQIEAQQRDIEIQIALIERSQIADEAGEAIELLKGQLRSLEGQKALAATAPVGMLSGIVRSIPATVANSQAVLAHGSVEAVVQSAHLLGEMTHEAYEHFSHALDKAVSKHYAAEQRHLNRATGTFERAGYGAVANHFQSVNDTLTRERDEAKKRGDWVTAREKDHLIAVNALSATNSALEVEDDPQRRTQLLQDQAAQEKIVADKRKALEAQYELDARKQARDQGMTGQAADAFVKQDVTQRMSKHDEAVAKQKAEANGVVSKNIQVQDQIDRANQWAGFERAGRDPQEHQGQPKPDGLTSIEPEEVATRRAQLAPASQDAVERDRASSRSYDRVAAAQSDDPFADDLAPPDPIAQAAKQFHKQVADKPDVKPDSPDKGEPEVKAPKVAAAKPAKDSKSAPSVG